MGSVAFTLVSWNHSKNSVLRRGSDCLFLDSRFLFVCFITDFMTLIPWVRVNTIGLEYTQNVHYIKAYKYRDDHYELERMNVIIKKII